MVAAVVATLPLLVLNFFYLIEAGTEGGTIRDRWDLVVINVLFFSLFMALLPYRRKIEWKSKGAAAAFFAALFAEMYGIPLGAYLLAPVVGGSGSAAADAPGQGIMFQFALLDQGFSVTWTMALGLAFTGVGMVIVAIGWKAIHRAHSATDDQEDRCEADIEEEAKAQAEAEAQEGDKAKAGEGTDAKLLAEEEAGTKAEAGDGPAAVAGTGAGDTADADDGASVEAGVREDAKASIKAEASGLVTTGLYAHSRHPQYLGFGLLIYGWLLGWPTLLGLAMVPLLVYIYHRLAREEEADAMAEWPAEYAQYAERVPRFI